MSRGAGRNATARATVIFYGFEVEPGSTDGSTLMQFDPDGYNVYSHARDAAIFTTIEKRGFWREKAKMVLYLYHPDTIFMAWKGNLHRREIPSLVFDDMEIKERKLRHVCDAIDIAFKKPEWFVLPVA